MATGAAAVAARARRDVVSHFMQRTAVDKQSAVSWTPDRRLVQRALAGLVRRGVIVETSPGTYYLDLPAYDDRRRMMRKRLALALLATMIAIAAMLLLTGTGIGLALMAKH